VPDPRVETWLSIPSVLPDTERRLGVDCLDATCINVQRAIGTLGAELAQGVAAGADFEMMGECRRPRRDTPGWEMFFWHIKFVVRAAATLFC